MKILDLINVAVVAETETGSLLCGDGVTKLLRIQDKVMARQAVY